MDIFVATGNPGKVREFTALTADIPCVTWHIASSYNAPEETGSTFKENAYIKAHALYEIQKSHVLADDSGLEVLALDHAPGVYSARYAGSNASDKDNIDKLVQELQKQNLEESKARFICTLAILLTDKDPIFIEESCEGKVITQKRGSNGFGYDPIFIPDGATKTFAEMEPHEKKLFSHRGKALQKLKSLLYDMQ